MHNFIFAGLRRHCCIDALEVFFWLRSRVVAVVTPSGNINIAAPLPPLPPEEYILGITLPLSAYADLRPDFGILIRQALVEAWDLLKYCKEVLVSIWSASGGCF